MKYEEYITQLGFAEDELKILSDIHKRCEEKEFFEKFSRARAEYDKGDETFEEYLNAFADKSGIHINTLNLYIYMRFLEDTYAEYKKLGIGDDIFLKTMSGFSVASRIISFYPLKLICYIKNEFFGLFPAETRIGNGFTEDVLTDSL